MCGFSGKAAAGMSIERGKEVIRIEAEAVNALADRLDDQFAQAVNLLKNSKGRVIVTGMGKSGIIGQKIASMLNSIGTPSFFLHPAEGVHGEMGAVLREDIVIAISKSGNTEELVRLIPMFKRLGVSMIAMTGNSDSQLAKRSDVVLDIGVKSEACAYDLVPTTSTTVTLVMGDALALALFDAKGISAEDFVQYHPGGAIGQRHLLIVDELMHSGEELPKVSEDTVLSDTILEMTIKRLGVSCVTNDFEQLVGIITDGDLRRLLEKKQALWDLTAKDVMTKSPKTIQKGTLAAKALHMMETYSITQLIVMNDDNLPLGVVHLHDLLKAEIA